MELFKDIAAVVGCILSCVSLITLCSQKGRTIIASLFKKHTKSLQEQNEKQEDDLKLIKAKLDIICARMDGHEEILKQQCRNVIKDIYYRYCDDKLIPLYERKTADFTYNLYTTLFNGNSYATLLYREICKWNIDTISYKELNDD